MNKSELSLDRIDHLLFVEHYVYSDSSSMSGNHYHNAYEIYYMLEGERYYFIMDRTYHVMKGDIVLININELHRTVYLGSPHAERILINVHPEYLEPLLKNIQDVDLFECFRRNIHVFRLPVQDQNYVESLLFRLKSEVESNLLGHETSSKILLIELLLFVSRTMLKTKSSNHEHPSPIHKKISEIVKDLNGNYEKDITLSGLSVKYNISLYHLSRLFKKATGFTFTEYLNIVRIRAAQKLLADTRLKVSRVAEDVGFKSITHFGRMFKVVIGLSPMQYRKSSIR